MKFHDCLRTPSGLFQCGCGFAGTLRDAIAHVVAQQPDLTR